MNNYNWDRDFPRVSKGFHDKLSNTLAQLPSKEEIIMGRKISLRRTIVFAVIAVMLLATTAVAVSKIYSTGSHSYNSEAFTQLPTVHQMKSVINASPKLIAQFDNGYKFEEGVVAYAEDMDESGKVLSKYKALDFTYVNGSNDIWLSMEKQNPDKAIPAGGIQSIYGNITLHAFSYVDKAVPVDYVKTEQDKRDEAEGRVGFSCIGGDTVEISVVQMLFWNDGDVSYSLSTRNNPLSSDELVTMAEQIIDQR